MLQVTKMFPEDGTAEAWFAAARQDGLMVWNVPIAAHICNAPLLKNGNPCLLNRISGVPLSTFIKPGYKEHAMSDETELPRWVIRRYAVVKDHKVDKFETLPGATAH